jgi:hypothetical protein
MKTYRNEKHGFEIDIPKEWLPAPIPGGGRRDFIQLGCPDEAFNFEIGPLVPERLLEYTESEFRLYAQIRGFTDLEFGRILVGGSEHVCARYRIPDPWGSRWNKKYMIVFGGMEYAITATCNDPQWFAQREKAWDAIVASFRLGESRQQAINKQSGRRRAAGGLLYEQAYQAVAEGRYFEARDLLERCLREDPNHTLAHKELAVVLRQLGDIRGALAHRREVKRLDPSDLLNRVNLVTLLQLLGAKEDALREIQELLEIHPDRPTFREIKESLKKDHPLLTYPQYYREARRKAPGNVCNLRLEDSTVVESKYSPFLRLVYGWNEALSRKEAQRIERRALAYIACAIYDAALAGGLLCRAYEVPYGLRPSWLIEDEKIPISLVYSDISAPDKSCELLIGTYISVIREPPSGGSHLAKLLTGFRVKYSEIIV